MSHQEKPTETRVESRRWIELSVPQLLAGALAAASAAVAASWLGVAGTVLGAVVASVVVTVSSALYARPIERSSQVIRESLPVLPVLPDRYRERNSTDTETLVLGGTVVDELERVEAPPADDGESTSRTSRPTRRIQWSSVAVSAVLTLVVGFGILTAFEAVIGKSASSLTGGDGGGSTIGRIVEGGNGSTTSNDDQPSKPAESGDDSDQPAPSDPSPTEPTDPTPTEPTDPTPTQPTEPTEPTPTEPTEPTDPAPTTDGPDATAPEGVTVPQGESPGAAVATNAA